MPSEKFYKKELAVLLKPVATPSGYLKSPTDLMKSKPFLAVKEAITLDEAQRKKQTLIFAHHAYNRLDSSMAKAVMVELRNLQKSGFRILIQWPDGLKEWDGIDLPADYSLDFKKFNKQTINQIAWSEFHIAPTDTFLLNYIGCYELIGFEVFFDAKYFKDKLDELAELILTIEEEPYKLRFQNSPEDASQFIKIISTKKASFPFSRCIEFFVENSTITASELSLVLENCTNLTKFFLRKCENISQALEKLIPGQLKELTFVHLSETYITPEAFLALTQAAPNLERIYLGECPCNIADLFRLFTTEQLAHLEVIYLDGNALDSFDLLSVLNRAPALKTLSLSDATITDDLVDLKLENPTKITFFDLGHTEISCVGIANLWKIAPLLSSLDISGMELEEFKDQYFSQFPENFFVNVNSICFEEENMSGKEKAELLKRVPNIKELKIKKGQFPIDRQHMSSVCLKKLSTVKLGDARSAAADLDLLSQIAPSIKKINLWVLFPGVFEMLAPMQLKNVKEIFIIPGAVGVPTRRDITKLFAAAPLLEEFILPVTAEVSDALEDLTVNQLPYLEAISLTKRIITLKALKCLLSAAPNLKGISLSSDMEDLLDAEVKLALKNIEVQYIEVQYSKENAFGSGLAGNDDAEAKPNQYSQLDDRYFDTKFKDQDLSYTEYFPGSGIDPSKYRLIPWHPNLDSLEGPPKKFIPPDLKEKILSDFVPDEKSFTCHKGICPTKYNEGDTIVLPSLDANEKVFNIKIVDSAGRVVEPKEIMFSESTQFHAVKLSSAGEYTIHYQVAIPKKMKAALPDKVQALVRKYNSYGQSDESPQQKFKTTREFAKYMQEHKPAAGSCRHRAVAAYDELVEDYDKNVRIMLNDVHAYMELKIGDDWHALDLGGYPGRKHKLPMQAKSLPMSLTARKEEKEEKIFTPPPIPFAMKEIDLDASLSRTFKKPVLVLTETDSALQDFYQNLHAQYPTANIFIAHDSEDLSLNGSGMTQEGQILLNYTALNQWLKKVGKKSGVICVDIREFNEKELAQLNDLLDGRIENEVLPKNIRIILVDRPQRGYYGPDFRRRVPNKVICISPEKKSVLKEKPKTLENYTEIDLYQSPYWQNIVLGRWQMQPSAKESVSFNWQKSELLNLLAPPVQREEKRISLFVSKLADAGKAIVFKNPPLQDPKFVTFMAEIQSLQKIAWTDQVTRIPPNASFYQASGYDWESLKEKVSLHALTDEERNPPYVLSDANILDFINDSAYRFSEKSDFLTVEEGYLKKYQKTGIDVLCAPGLTKSTLARFLAEAKKRDMPVRFLTPNLAKFPEKSPLAEIFKPIADWEAKRDYAKLNIEYKESTDVPYTVQSYLISSEKKITAIDVTSLDASELIRQPILDQDLKDQLIKHGTLTMKSHLADIAKKLLDGETVLLYGRIAPDLYEAIATLALGYVEGKRYSGKLILVTPPENAALVDELTSRKIIDQPSPEDIFNLFKKIYPDAEEEKKTKFLELKKSYIKSKLAKNRTPLVDSKEKKPDDEELSKRFEQRRLKDTQNALSISPWVMIEGPTGIGKTHFLQEILAKAETVVPTLSQWLESKPTKEGQHLIYVVDEASFMSQLSGEGENFLERFKGLGNTPPCFYWQGKHYPLTPEHKVVFAFNPASYGAGRSTQGILNEHSVPVSFERLPYFYIRARVIAPLLKEALPKEFSANLNWIADPIYQVFKWFESPELPADLLSPREIKMIVNIIVSQIKAKGIKDKEIIDLASEAAYLIGKQALSDQSKEIQALFDKDCKPSKASMLNAALPKHYLPKQQEAYSCFQSMLIARSALQALHKETKGESSTDLGLGGVVIEGAAGIGKTHFIEQFIEELKERKEVYYRISPSTPYAEKEAILRKAFAEGAIVVGEELNASLWPNKMLNNFLMGLDEKGIPAKKPGFMLFATQNPSYFPGRSEEDPALRRRMIKLVVDWPVYQAPELEAKANATNLGSSMFAGEMQELKLPQVEGSVNINLRRKTL